VDLDARTPANRADAAVEGNARLAAAVLLMSSWMAVGGQ
jgi:hypothetical protein